MNTYFLCITQPYNLGDLIINKMLIDELCKYGKVFVDIYNTPSNFASYLLKNDNAIDVYHKYGITVKRLKLWSLLKLIRKEKIQVYTTSPGPLEDPNFLVRKVLTFIEKFFLYHKVNIYPIGKCGSMMLYNNKIYKNSNIRHIYLRSQKSVEYINQNNHGIASYMPDLAFLFRQYATINPSEKRICMTFRDMNNSAFRDKCIQMILACAVEGYTVDLFYQVETDKLFMDYIYSHINHPNVHYRNQLLWYDELNFYSGSSFVISNRLHALIMGIVYNAVPIAFVHDHAKTIKIRDVFESIFTQEQLDNIYLNNDFSQNISETLSKANHSIGAIDTIAKELCKECHNTIKALSSSY